MGMLTGQNDLAYPVFSENFFQISAVESAIEAFWRNDFPLRLRIPMKPAIDSETKPATCSDFIPASIPI